MLPVIYLPYASASNTVTFYLPSNSPDWLNVVYGNNNVGVIHIKMNTTSSGTPDTWAEAYCVTSDLNIYVGNTYTAALTQATDTPTNRSVGYILGWYHESGTYTPLDADHPGYSNSKMTASQAASIQNAIWYYTDSKTPSGDALASAIIADSTGKDVIRASDSLTINSVSSDSTHVTLEAKVTQADATTPRNNVLVVFKLTGITGASGITTPVTQTNVPSGYTYEGVTDSNGKITFTVTFDNSAPIVQVEAYTQGVWPEVLDPNSGEKMLQVLTPVPLASNIVIKTAIYVLPDYPLGSLIAIASCLAGFVIVRKKMTSQPNTVF